MYLSRWLERVLPPSKMGGPEDDDQEGELMSDQEETLGETQGEREGELEEVTKHWAVRAAASIALLFKVCKIQLTILLSLSANLRKWKIFVKTFLLSLMKFSSQQVYFKSRI